MPAKTKKCLICGDELVRHREEVVLPRAEGKVGRGGIGRVAWPTGLGVQPYVCQNCRAVYLFEA